MNENKPASSDIMDLIDLATQMEFNHSFVLRALTQPFNLIENFEFYVHNIKPFSIITKTLKKKTLEFSFYSTKDNNKILNAIENHCKIGLPFGMHLQIQDRSQISKEGKPETIREFVFNDYVIDEVLYGPLTYEPPSYTQTKLNNSETLYSRNSGFVFITIRATQT